MSPSGCCSPFSLPLRASWAAGFHVKLPAAPQGVQALVLAALTYLPTPRPHLRESGLRSVILCHLAALPDPPFGAR